MKHDEIGRVEGDRTQRWRSKTLGLPTRWLKRPSASAA